MATTYRNNRNGRDESVTTDLTPTQLAERFVQLASSDHWAYFWMAKLVEENKARPEATQQGRDMMAFIADSFLFAIGMGLKNPMIRLHYNGRRYKIYLSAKGTICFKTGTLVPGTHQPQGDEEYMGCLVRGTFLEPSRSNYNANPYKMCDTDREFLRQLNADPVAFLAQCSKDMNRCCYCNLPLEDSRSKEVGYGPICAGRWGLPWGASTGDQKVPSFAELWAKSDTTTRRNIRGICQEIRAAARDGRDAELWEILGDLLNEAGYTKRPEPPAMSTKMPAAG